MGYIIFGQRQMEQEKELQQNQRPVVSTVATSQSRASLKKQSQVDRLALAQKHEMYGSVAVVIFNINTGLIYIYKQLSIDWEGSLQKIVTTYLSKLLPPTNNP